MATVYILYSGSLDKFYVGSCKDLGERIDQHISKYFPKAFTGKAKDWIVYLYLSNLLYSQARKIEFHIKNMKSKKYIENLKAHPDLLTRLVALYK